MRLLHLYAGNMYGGVETFLVALARHRAMSKMEPAFGLCFEGRLSEELKAQGARVENLGAVRFSRPWSVLSARRNLGALLGRERFDAVIAHSVWPHAVFAPVVRRQGLPLVYWAHNPPSAHWLDRLANRTAPDLVVANSEFTLSQHGGLFGGAARCVLRYPVSAPVVDVSSARREVRGELQTDEREVVIVCFCRLEAWKGHALLLDALAKLSAVPGWTAWIAGGPQRDSEHAYLADLQRQASRGGIESRVRFIGQRSDIPRVLSAADIHCQPNTGPEPFGIAFVEALYAGLPVVTTAIGGAMEIVTADCGLLVMPAAGELAEALRRLIEDRDLRTRLGSQGPKRAAELCDPSVTVPMMEMELSKVIASRSSRCAS